MAEKKLSSYIIPSVLGIGTGLRAASAIVAGQSAVDASRYNANAIDQEIKNLGFASDISKKQLDRQLRQLEGEQVTAVGTSGLAMSGSVVDVMADSAAQGKLQELLQTRQVQEQQAALRREKDIGEWKAKQKQKGSYFEAFGTLGSGIVKIMERK